MAFVSLDSTDIQADKPITADLFKTIKDNEDYLYGVAVGQSVAGINNGSFEIDSDADGIPNSWEWTAYAGGSGSVSTVTNHGAYSFAIEHPGGAGNGGGMLQSDFISASTNEQYAIHFDLWNTNATGCRNKVQITPYLRDQTTAATETTLHDSTSHELTARKYAYNYTPPANTRFIKVNLIGGATDETSTNITYYDNVIFTQDPSFYQLSEGTLCGFDSDAAEHAITNAGYAKIYECWIQRGGTVTVKYTVNSTELSGNARGRIYRNGSAIGTEHLTTISTAVTTSLFLPATGNNLVQIYGASTPAGNISNISVSATRNYGEHDRTL